MTGVISGVVTPKEDETLKTLQPPPTICNNNNQPGKKQIIQK